MAKYINTAEIEKCTGVAIITYSDGNKKSKDVICVSKEDFDNMPTIDIVHCGECRHIDKTICLTSFPEKFICKIDNKSHTVDWFCADGERKSDD